MSTNDLHSYEKALKNGEPVYVTNNTDPRGSLVLTIHDHSSGKPKPLTFPKTWIPFCLTDLLPRDTLLASIEIRQELRKRTLKWLPEDEAKQILDSQKAQREYQRLYQSEYAAGTLGGSSQNKQDLLNAQALNKQVLTTNAGDPNGGSREELTLHPKLLAWEQRVTVGELDGAALESELEVHKAEFTLEDLQYMISGKFPQEAKDFSYEQLKSGSFRKRASETAAPAAAPAAPTKGQTGYEADWS